MTSNSSSPEGAAPTTNGSSSTTTPSTPEIEHVSVVIKDMAEQIQREHDAARNSLYVIYSARHNSIVHDARSQKPIANKNPQILEVYLRRIKQLDPSDDGKIVTLAEAMAKFFSKTKKS